MLIATALLLTVLITVEERVPCAAQDHGLRATGRPMVYERVPVPRGVREPCERTRRVQEEWTDLPERGGRFLRTIRELVE